MFQGNRYFDSDLVWFRDDAALIFAPRTAQRNYESLHSIELSGDAESLPRHLAGQFSDRINRGVSWMPDGKTLLYISKPVKP